jgi:hypothetical protein
MAGSESGAGNPLIKDLIVFGQKLEKIGFIYNHGSVVIIEALEYRNV